MLHRYFKTIMSFVLLLAALVCVGCQSKNGDGQVAITENVEMSDTEMNNTENNETQAYTRHEFDENSIVMRFGVLSDIHTYNENGPLDKAYKTLLQLAGEDENGKTQLDAVLINGDIINSMASWGQVTPTNKLPTVAAEMTAFRNVTLNNFKNTDVRVFYSYGNHDTAGGGIGAGEDQRVDTTGFYSTSLWEKFLSGYDYSNTVPSNDNATVSEVIAYNKQQINEYDQTEGENYEFFYGNDLFLGEDGLSYGNRHTVINGYHFLAVEPSAYSGDSVNTFSAKTLKWLDATLKEITAAEPNKAVFVLSHSRIQNTIFGSMWSSTLDLTAVLNKYPQVVLFGGHNHSTLYRETAIWANKFMCVDAGVLSSGSSTAYISEIKDAAFSVELPKNMNPNDVYKAQFGLYIEIDSNGCMRINRVDFYNTNLSKDQIALISNAWLVDNVGAKGEHLEEYKTETRKNNNTAPIFVNNGNLQVTAKDGGINVAFDAAYDDDRVISYFVTVLKDGEQIAEAELTSYWYLHPDASELNDYRYEYEFVNIPTGNITVTVTAVDDFGASAAISS